MEFLRAVFWSENKSKNIIMLYNTNKKFSIAPVAFTRPPIKPPIPKMYFGLIKITQKKNIHAPKILICLQKTQIINLDPFAFHYF